ncbi:hypothetical protein Pfo_022558 [Paulownia fortunei]|nr:hypothetical protein Pfo_022558 [Paulownia fortunei]
MKEPDVSEKLEDLHNELKEMKIKIAGRNTATNRGIPFTEEVIMDDLPANFISLNYDYDGTTDPWEHLCRFENSALLHRYSDGVKCRFCLFASICKFSETQKNVLDFIQYKQKDNEALRSYIKRFTGVALEVPSATQEDGEFFRSLAKKSARSFDDLLAQAEKYINMEEAQQMKRDEGERKRERREKLKTEERPLLPIPGKPRQYTPLPKSNLFCAFHNEYGHNTEECRHLKDKIERMIRKGWLDDWVKEEVEKEMIERKKARPTWIERDTKEGKVGAAPGENHYHALRGFIQMILEGPTDGDSNRARNVTGDPIGPHDMEGLQAPHNDALVITATVANFDVARIMVDTSSSVDVLFYEAYKKMNLDITLQPVDTALFGFGEGVVDPMGQVVLPISLGTEPMRKTRMVKFLVVDSFSAYNIILGRPSLNTFQAVVSTFHMKLKFHVDKGIGEVEGDQCSARRCYVEAVRKAEQKKAKREQSIEGEPPLKVMKRSEAERPSDEQEHVMPNEELINIELIPGDGTRTTRIGTQMCIDFRDLNKACPKDHYPLPRIDQLVDSTSGCELLSMMDAS